jgi:molybdopterin-containing oxidoreductase family iron-sulfur binding subunit
MREEKLWKTLQLDDRWGQLASKGEEPAEFLNSGVSRRTFIEMIGFSAAALAFSGCRAPEQKIVPSLVQPVEFTPGVAVWYASTCGGCSSACGALVKVRDGRPIKLEGNPEHTLSAGGLCPVAHGMVFGLYDSERLRQPMAGSKPASWDEVDGQITARLEAIKAKGGKIRVLSGSITSPSSLGTIGTFLSQFPGGQHVFYDSVSCSAIRGAHSRSHGTAAIPGYALDKARLIVSFGGDFLGTWISPVQHTRAYTRARSLQGIGEAGSADENRGARLRHVQIESRLSLTGSNADLRLKVSPAQELEALRLLAALVAANSHDGVRAGLPQTGGIDLRPHVRQVIEQIAEQIVSLKGESLVVSGANDIDAQYLVNWINHAAGSYGVTVDLGSASRQKQGDDGQVAGLVREMNAGDVAALIILGSNPAYDYDDAPDFVKGLSKVPLKISLNPYRDETSALVDFICPHHHFLEAWDDAEPVSGVFSLNQPVIRPLFQTRAYQESLLRWTGDPRGHHEVLKQYWQDKVFPLQKESPSFQEFWDKSLRDGIFTPERQSSPEPSSNFDDLAAASTRLAARAERLSETLSVVLYEKIALRDGAHAGNPWLQELPDPVSKITWDNYASVSPDLAEKMGFDEGTIVRVSNAATAIELPVHIQPGQGEGSVAIALGYGRTRAGRGGSNVGANAYGLVALDNGTFQYVAPGISLEKTGGKVVFASTQLHQSLDGRPLVRDLSIAEYLERRKSAEGEQSAEPRSIWKDHQYGEHKWGMVVDLNACTGCSACVLSCQAENNIPVVGKDEVRRQREMHWLRVDRYAAENGDGLKVSYQPVMCAQCDNASCESVCPVLATVHSSEGLNMQVYNRCVGTRYCENNCPYKVRRFNWFENAHADPVSNLALNPDVTVRTRGVMEKCTFCVQRIEEAKIRARNEGRTIRDGEIQTACQQSCPAAAITFGDLVDPGSQVGRLKHDERDFILLEELNLRPAISYLARVRSAEQTGA